MHILGHDHGNVALPRATEIHSGLITTVIYEDSMNEFDDSCRPSWHKLVLGDSLTSIQIRPGSFSCLLSFPRRFPIDEKLSRVVVDALSIEHIYERHSRTDFKRRLFT